MDLICELKLKTESKITTRFLMLGLANEQWEAAACLILGCSGRQQSVTTSYWDSEQDNFLPVADQTVKQRTKVPCMSDSWGLKDIYS